MSLRSPIRWIGGKGKLAPRILPFFPPHQRYVEPFGGGASLLLAKDPVAHEVYNDLNPQLVRLFNDIRHHGQALFNSVALTPFSRREQRHTRERLGRCGADVMVAYRQSFGGKLSGYGIERTSTNGTAATIHNYLRSIGRLPQLAERLQQVELRSEDAVAVIQEFDSSETLHYLDPPYVPDTWTGEDVYGGHLMSRQHHQQLVELLLVVKGMVVLSGYPNAVYAPLEAAGWTTHTFQVSCSVAARTDSHGLKGTGSVKERQPRIERLWINPPAQERLR